MHVRLLSLLISISMCSLVVIPIRSTSELVMDFKSLNMLAVETPAMISSTEQEYSSKLSELKARSTRDVRAVSSVVM